MTSDPEVSGPGHPGPAQPRAVRVTNVSFDTLMHFPVARFVGLLVLALALIAAGSHLAGGARSAGTHLYYVPVVLAAIRLGASGGVAAALASALLAGPLLPADVTSGQEQSPAAWITRGIAFLAVALLVSWLARHAEREVNRQVEDVRCVALVRGALARGEMVVHYQPVVAMADRRVVGFEALVRWVRPGHGIVAAGDFVPAAERSGVIAEIDSHVLRQSLRQVAAWRHLGEFSIAVNVSAKRFAQPGLAEEITEAVRESGIDIGQVRIEVTESSIIGDVAAAAAQITALREVGVQVAIDDFGTGHSSLSYLHRFDVDIVKIPRAFVDEVSVDPKRTALVTGMVQFLQALGTDVVAEGISSPDEYEHLRAIGCPFGQGFYLGRPAPAEEIETLIGRSGTAGVRPRT